MALQYMRRDHRSHEPFRTTDLKLPVFLYRDAHFSRVQHSDQ